MVRSKLAIVGLVLVVLGVVVVKLNRTPRAAARTEGRPVSAAPATTAAPAEEKASPYLLSGADMSGCLKNGKPTVADFGEGWCEQCKKQAPVLDATATKYQGKANVLFVDTKAYPELGRAYNITAIPTQIFFDAKGHEVTRHVGYYPPEEVAKDLAKVGAK